MYFSVILKYRDGKAGGKNISQQYSITIHISYDPVITAAWDNYRTVRVQKQFLNKKCKIQERQLVCFLYALFCSKVMLLLPNFITERSSKFDILKKLFFP